MPMLDTTVTYTGLPQDDWNNATSTRKTSSYGPKSPQAAQKTCRHATTFMVFVIIFGVSVAVLIPLLIRRSGITSFPKDTSTPFPKKGLSNHSFVDYDDSFYNDLPPSKGKVSSSISYSEVTSKPSKKNSVKPKVTKSTVLSKAKTTKTLLKKLPSLTTYIMTTPIRTTSAHQNTTTIRPSTMKSSTYSTSNSPLVTKIKDHDEKSVNSNASSIISKIIDAIYKNGNATSGSGSDKDLEMRIKELLKTRPSFEVVIFGTAAVFFGLLFLLLGISCILQKRKAANRRVTFQDVVTDLQSPEKVVLLTSDLSEEE